MIDDATTDAELDECTTQGCGARASTSSPTWAALPTSSGSTGRCRRVASRGWHVVLHFDAADLPRYADLLDRHALPVRDRPHGPGGRDRRCSSRRRSRHSSGWWPTSVAGSRCRAPSGSPPRGSPPYDDVVPFARALIAAAPDRVLWGTDWPHPNVRHMPDDGDLVDLLAAFAPDKATRDRILVGNPERLYDFAPISGSLSPGPRPAR